MSQSPKSRPAKAMLQRVRQRTFNMLRLLGGRKADLIAENEALQARVAELDKVAAQKQKLKKKLAKSEQANEQMQGKVDALREKVERLKAARDRTAGTDGASSKGTAGVADPVAYNTAASMDAFYAEPDNISKYNSQKQYAVYRLFLEQLVAGVDGDVQSVLDAGCGLGLLTALVKDRFPEATVSGFDFSEEAIRQASADRPDIKYFVHDIYQTPGRQYTLILCTETLEHLSDPAAAVEALLPALAPGGSAFFTVPDGRVDQSSRHIQFWSPESWAGFMHRCAGSGSAQAGVIEHPSNQAYRYNWGIITASRHE